VGARQLDPAQSVAAHDLGHHIEQLVEQLPPEQKEVFVMRTQAHIAFKEIARIQGVSINTALARMHYALGKLREELAGEYGPEGG
jgi:RNA polymerase sigma factor (sigma-70 family)